MDALTIGIVIFVVVMVFAAVLYCLTKKHVPNKMKLKRHRPAKFRSNGSWHSGDVENFETPCEPGECDGDGGGDVCEGDRDDGGGCGNGVEDAGGGCDYGGGDDGGGCDVGGGDDGGGGGDCGGGCDGE